MQPGDLLELTEPDMREEQFRPSLEKPEDYFRSGQRWQGEVFKVEPSSETDTVYNLEVEDFHTYFVNWVWVHNKNTVLENESCAD